MIEIKKFKFVSNLEYVHSILDEQNIPHSIDTENLSLYSDDFHKTKIIQIINDLNLDENDVEIDDSVLEGYQEWNKNMYNPGYYTGGKIPFFYQDKKFYLVYGFTALIGGLVYLIEYVNRESFSSSTFWILLLIILLISGSMFYQYYKFKQNKF